MGDVVESALLHRDFDAHFQPIISLKREACIGVEALSRFYHPQTGQRVSPQEVFEWASQHGLALELDRACRGRAFEQFARHLAAHPDLLLFFNFETSLLDEGVEGSGSIYRAVKEAGLSPNSVVIEVNESKVVDIDSLVRFVDAHRKHGFLIAMDDVGKGYSALERIPLLRPDILKIDRNIFQGMTHDLYKKEIMRSMLNLGQKIGALTLAEAVETEDEVISNALLGADLMQGYFFGAPLSAERLDLAQLATGLQRTGERYVEHVQQSYTRRQSTVQQFAAHFQAIRELIQNTTLQEFEDQMRRAPRLSPEIECIFGLDPAGIQITPTFVFHASEAARLQRLYEPAQRGANHKMKEYYLSLVSQNKQSFITDPYVSLATGSLCRTYSGHCVNAEGIPLILCMDQLHGGGLL